jgi:hypothetical protein
MENVKDEFKGYLRESIDSDKFVRLTFGKYRGGDKDFENIYVSRIETKEGEKLSFKFRYKTKDIVKNYDFNAGIRLADEILGKDFFSATIFTTEKDYSVDYSKKRIPQLHIKKPTYKTSLSESHNKVKSRFVKEDSKFLNLLGISTAEGKIKPEWYGKFRQIDKFTEILDSLYRTSKLEEKEEIRITDMGSGKSYLTFAVYDYFRNTLNKNVKVTGIEQKEDLVKLSNRISSQCGFDGLNFISANIESQTNDKPDITTALHACDTATDDAICKALESDSEIIILAPCCQKYVRKKLSIPERLKGIFRYGIQEERLASMLTDGLRALVLEYFGYEVKVFEFISQEHTAKNTMITAVKKHEKNPDKLKEIFEIKKEFGTEDFYLDRKLNLKTE